MNRTIVCMALSLYSERAAEFEVASIKPGRDQQPGGASGITTGKGRMTAENVTLQRCIVGAFAVGPQQIVGGPEWMDTVRFDIVARAARPVGDAALMDMLQTLLAARFKLACHRETRMRQTYGLSTGKNGPKLVKPAGGKSSTTSGRGRIEARATTMDGFAQRLGRQMDLPVVNQTGLEGAFDLALEWAPDVSKADDRPSVFTALQSLGFAPDHTESTDSGACDRSCGNAVRELAVKPPPQTTTNSTPFARTVSAS